MKPPMYQEQLDHMGCAGCNEQHVRMYFHGLCHIQATTECSYDPASGTLLIACAECKKEIAVVAVARQKAPQ